MFITFLNPDIKILFQNSIKEISGESAFHRKFGPLTFPNFLTPDRN